MPSLKDYRDRIASVKSTRKITSAMKLVAASKLKKAQEKAEASQPYSQRMGAIVSQLLEGMDTAQSQLKLISGTGRDETHLLVIVTSDRGLAGGFNANVIRMARLRIETLQKANKTVKLICVGRKGRDALRGQYSDLMVEYFEGPGKKDLSFEDANAIGNLVLEMLESEQFDVCALLYNQFKSVILQDPTSKQLVPLAPDVANDDQDEGAETDETSTLYEFEPAEEELLASLLPKNFKTQLYAALLDSAAGEQAARMTAMDNATRNAGDRINQLTLIYNRARQAAITTELIEIISGAESL